MSYMSVARMPKTIVEYVPHGEIKVGQQADNDDDKIVY